MNLRRRFILLLFQYGISINWNGWRSKITPSINGERVYGIEWCVVAVNCARAGL